MTLGLLAAAFMLLWAGFTLLIDGWQRPRRRPPLEDRLRPYQVTVASEAEEWLRARRSPPD